MNIQCDYGCGSAELVKGDVIYPHRPDLAHKNYWLCRACGAYVGTHMKNRKHNFTGIEPLGRLANAELRRAKNMAHAAFDPLWRGETREMTRKQAYSWLAKTLGISIDQCHIGMFDVHHCKAVVEVVKRRA